MAERKNRQIEEYLNTPIKVGDRVFVKSGLVDAYTSSPDKMVSREVLSVQGDTLILTDGNDHSSKAVKIQEVIKDTDHIGFNPFKFKGWRMRTRPLLFSLSTIDHNIFRPDNHEHEGWKINGVHVRATNFNPYVTDCDGNRQYYQRPPCWLLEDKRNLIESIYRDLHCGQVVVRKRSDKDVTEAMQAGDTEVCCMDIVDGKQRLNCIHDFLNDAFTDRHGNYFSDLSAIAQHRFNESMCLGYAEMDENTTDSDVIEAFLNVNYTGVPQSREHIEHVERIAEMLGGRH